MLREDGWAEPGQSSFVPCARMRLNANSNTRSGTRRTRRQCQTYLKQFHIRRQPQRLPRRGPMPSATGSSLFRTGCAAVEACPLPEEQGCEDEKTAEESFQVSLRALGARSNCRHKRQSACPAHTKDRPSSPLGPVSVIPRNAPQSDWR